MSLFLSTYDIKYENVICSLYCLFTLLRYEHASHCLLLMKLKKENNSNLMRARDRMKRQFNKN
jgi:hypothetical protein